MLYLVYVLCSHDFQMTEAQENWDEYGTSQNY